MTNLSVDAVLCLKNSKKYSTFKRHPNNYFPTLALHHIHIKLSSTCPDIPSTPSVQLTLKFIYNFIGYKPQKIL